MFDRHPHLNRFVSGGRVYDRDGIWISFTVKTELSDDGTLVEVKHHCDPAQPFADFVRDIETSVAAARGGVEDLTDKELSIFLHLPPVLRRGVVLAAGLANALNVLPRAFIDGDPFFATPRSSSATTSAWRTASTRRVRCGTCARCSRTPLRREAAPGQEDRRIVRSPTHSPNAATTAEAAKPASTVPTGKVPAKRARSASMT
jgi:hypothetical protein